MPVRMVVNAQIARYLPQAFVHVGSTPHCCASLWLPLEEHRRVFFVNTSDGDEANYDGKKSGEKDGRDKVGDPLSIVPCFRPLFWGLNENTDAPLAY